MKPQKKPDITEKDNKTEKKKRNKPVRGDGDRAFLLDSIIKKMKGSSPEKPVKKVEIIKHLKEKGHYNLNRSTLDKKFKELEKKGYTLVKLEGKRGFYLEDSNRPFEDYELRLLADSILYSNIAPEQYTAGIIEKLGAMGSDEFSEQMSKRALTAKFTSHSNNKNIFLYIEDIQEAIFKNKQISCNVIDHDYDFEPVKRYKDDIVVNPYELAFSNGKYYLVCALDGSDELTIFRVDRLTDVQLLDSACVEVSQLKKIKSDKGLQKYISSQPELKGGQREVFTLICYRDSLNDVYDAFDGDLRIANVDEKNYDDPETVRVSVETTHDAMVAWAITHADSVVVIYPQSVRDEIMQTISNAQHTYFKTGRPARIRSMTARSIEEALREMRIAGINRIHYTGRTKKGIMEQVDLGKHDVSGIKSITLWHCDLSECTLNNDLTDVESLTLDDVNVTVDFLKHFPKLINLVINRTNIDDLSFLNNCKELKQFTLIGNDYLSDFSPLCKLSNLCLFRTDSETFTESEISKLRASITNCEVKIFEPSKNGYKMALRPAYTLINGKVNSIDYEFKWYAGFSLEQKQRSINELHEAIARLEVNAKPLEISTKSTTELGVKLSAFNLKLNGYTLENIFQSSKVFRLGGPFRDLLEVEPKEAKTDERLRHYGPIISFNYDGYDFPTEPKTVFYDYIYIKAVRQSISADEISGISDFTHFTDIEFNPQKSINTQARTVAIIKLMLEKFGELPDMTVEEFIEFHKANVIE